MIVRPLFAANAAIITLVLLSLCSLPVQANSDEASDADNAPLPDILSLENVLSIAEINGSPEREIAEAEILVSDSELAKIQSRYGIRIKAELAPRYVYAIDTTKGDDINDSYYFLGTSKILSDFGRTAQLTEAAEAELRADAIEFVSFRFRRRLKLIEAYLNVLLADQFYAVEDEKMTIKFLKYDKARERHDLGEVSDVDLIGLESAYREDLISRMRSANRQSEARARLAALLNRPDEFPAELLPVMIDIDEIEISEYQDLLSSAL